MPADWPAGIHTIRCLNRNRWILRARVVHLQLLLEVLPFPLHPGTASIDIYTRAGTGKADYIVISRIGPFRVLIQSIGRVDR